MNKQRLSILIIGILGGIGTFLPWVTIPILGSVNGTEGDGLITLFLFLVPVAISLIKDRSKNLKGGLFYTAIISSVIAGIIGIYDLVNFKSGDLGLMRLTMGPGLYVIAAAGLLLPIVAFIMKEKEE
jgi:hypothetical protein